MQVFDDIADTGLEATMNQCHVLPFQKDLTEIPIDTDKSLAIDHKIIDLVLVGKDGYPSYW